MDNRFSQIRQRKRRVNNRFVVYPSFKSPSYDGETKNIKKTILVFLVKIFFVIILALLAKYYNLDEFISLLIKYTEIFTNLN